jgi:hypothetical protein
MTAAVNGKGDVRPRMPKFCLSVGRADNWLDASHIMMAPRQVTEAYSVKAMTVNRSCLIGFSVTIQARFAAAWPRHWMERRQDGL